MTEQPVKYLSIHGLGLRTKLAIFISAIIGLISVFIFFYFPKNHEIQEVEATAVRAKSIAGMTAFSVGAAILFDDSTTIQEAFGAARENKDLVYIVVQNKNGAVLAAFNLDEAIRQHYDRSPATDRISETAEVFQTAAHVLHRDEELGRVFIGLSLAELQREVRSVRIAIGTLSGLIFLIGIFIAYGMTTWITGPLRLIVNTARQISTGDLSHRAPVITKDEVGTMAEAFNTMVDNLETMNRELESRVRERTVQLSLQSEQLRAFSQLGRVLNSALTFADAARTIVDAADHLFGWEACSIDYYAEDQNIIMPILNVDTINGVRMDVPPISLGRAPDAGLRKIIENGAELVLKTNDDGVPANETGFAARPALSLMFAPMRSGKRVTGILSIQSYKQRAYTDRDLETLQSLADYCGGALERISNINKLEDSEKNYRDIVEFAPVGIYRSMRDGTILSANNELSHILGYASTAELKACGMNRLYANPDDREGVIKRSEEEESSQNVEVLWKKKDGTTVWIDLTCHRVLDEDGKPRYFEGFVRDISERKSLEAQFLRAQRLESLGTLAGGIAHDLNNVLGPIMLTLDVLKMGIQDEKYQKMLASAQVSAVRGKNIVSQILMFAKGNQGERGPVQAKYIVREVLDIIRVTFPRDIQIKSFLEKDLHLTNADATQIHQVVMNLCLNARDAMSDGGILTLSATNFAVDEQFERLHISTKRGQYVLLSVCDTGTGIPPEIIEKIFDPFFTTKEVGKGTGLGLSTVHAVVKNHGGFVDVESKPGNGSTFRVYLPAIEGGVVADDEARPDSIQAGAGQTILVVDDEETIREVVKETLESFGYNVLTAEDGIGALASFSVNREKISAVVTDIMMPAMDGIALIRALRRMEPHLKIIAVSGMLAESYVHALKGLEIGAVLSKPFTARDLLAALHEELKS